MVTNSGHGHRGNGARQDNGVRFAKCEGVNGGVLIPNV